MCKLKNIIYNIYFQYLNLHLHCKNELIFFTTIILPCTYISMSHILYMCTQKSQNIVNDLL